MLTQFFYRINRCLSAYQITHVFLLITNINPSFVARGFRPGLNSVHPLPAGHGLRRIVIRW
jgi:hypothetical protein